MRRSLPRVQKNVPEVDVNSPIFHPASIHLSIVSMKNV
jgi:hypothetical protein